MPRKERVAKQTRAERFLAEQEAHEVQVAPGIYELRPSREIKAMARLLSRHPCAVDEPLAEAIAKDFLAADKFPLREQLYIRAVCAQVAAEVTYRTALSIPARADRQRKAKRLAEALREFLEGVEKEVEFADYVADKAEPQPDETNQTDSQSDDVANERKISMLGEELVPLLDVYASEPLPNTGDATDHDVREFFLSLEDWWQGTAINTDRRGAKAVRNRIAAALWMDMGRSIPQGYSSEEWAKRQFRHWGNLQAKS